MLCIVRTQVVVQRTREGRQIFALAHIPSIRVLNLRQALRHWTYFPNQV